PLASAAVSSPLAADSPSAGGGGQVGPYRASTDEQNAPPQPPLRLFPISREEGLRASCPSRAHQEKGPPAGADGPGEMEGEGGGEGGGGGRGGGRGPSGAEPGGGGAPAGGLEGPLGGPLPVRVAPPGPPPPRRARHQPPRRGPACRRGSRRGARHRPHRGD